MNWEYLITIIAPPMQASLSGAWLYLVLLVIGGFIGVLTGFFGVGGGFLIVPLLNIVVGINYELAVGSSLSFILGTSFTGMMRQRSQGNVYLAAAGYIAAGSVIGSVLGDLAQEALLFSIAGGSRHVFTMWMHGLFLVVLAVTMIAVKASSRESAEQERTPMLLARGPRPMFSSEGNIQISIPLTFLIGLIIGVMTGLLGIGGGVLLVPILLGLFGLGHRTAVGTSLAIVVITSLSGIIKKGFSDIPKVSLPLTVLLIAGSIFGLQLGIMLLRRSGEKSFRRYFTYIIILAMALIAADLLGMIRSS